MTGRQEYDRTKDRQRTLGKYMIDSGFWPRVRARALRAPVFLRLMLPQTGRCAPPPAHRIAVSYFSSLLFNFFLFFSSYPSLLISSYSSCRYYFLSSYSSPLIFLTVDIHISVILRGFSRGNKPFLTHLGVTIHPNFFVLFFSSSLHISS